MFRKSLIPLLAAALLVAPSMLPRMFVPSTTVDLSSSAEAATTVNSSKSNASSYKACVKGGGTVTKDSKGNEDCTPKKK